MPKKKVIKRRPTKKKQRVTLLVHNGYRLMLTDAEYNRAWMRAKKYSGLG